MRVQSTSDGQQTTSVAATGADGSGVVIPFNAPDAGSFDQVLQSLTPQPTATPTQAAQSGTAAASGAQGQANGATPFASLPGFSGAQGQTAPAYGLPYGALGQYSPMPAPISPYGLGSTSPYGMGSASPYGMGSYGLPTGAMQMGYAGMQAYGMMPVAVMMVPVMGMMPYGAMQGSQTTPTVGGAQNPAPATVGGTGSAQPVGGAQSSDSTALRIPFAGAPNVTQPFGPTSFTSEPPYKGYSHFHTGIDFGIPSGTPIGAAAGGKVVAAGWDDTGYGNRVLIDHGNGRYTIYGHLEQVTVRPGDWVQPGDQIGLSGSTGNSTGPHLHFGLEVNGEWVDPAPYLFPGGSVSGQTPMTTPAGGQDAASAQGGTAGGTTPIFGQSTASAGTAPATGDNPAGKTNSRNPGLPPDLPIFRQPPGSRTSQPGSRAGQGNTATYTPAISRGQSVPVFSPAGATTPSSGNGLPADLPIFSKASAVGGGSAAPQTGPSATNLDSAIQQVAQQVGVPAALLAAMVQAESAGDPNAVSSSGAKGLMQLMDGTATQYGVTNSFDPQQNLTAGAEFLRDLLTQFNGNERLAVAAYNAGPSTVQRYGGVPPYPETEQYVQKVLGLEQSYAARYAGITSN